MQLPYYLVDNYAPFPCDLPTFYPLTDSYNQPTYTLFFPPDLANHA